MLVRACEDASLLLIPPGLAGASIVYLGFKLLNSRFRRSLTANGTFLPDRQADVGSTANKTYSSFSQTVYDYDGISIVLFRIMRLLMIAALLALEVYGLSSKGDSSLPAYLHSAFFIYASILGLCTIFASASEWRDITSRQLAVLLLSEFAVYGFLDVWPYATQSPHPFDPASDPATWIRITLLALSSVIIPLIMPRPFRPLTPGAERAANEVASLLSRVTFSFLDKIVFYAWRVPDIGINDMPNLPQRNSVNALIDRGMKGFDPLLLNRKRHVIWGFIEMWGKDYFMTFVWDFVHALSAFIGVVGTRNLLMYLETGISNYGLQPWVWIIMLGSGPIISACVQTQYNYIGSRINIENLSFISYLVYHHSIRIRLKADIMNSEKKKDDKAGDDSGEGSSQALLSPADTDAESSTAGKSATSSDTVPEGGHAKEKTGVMVGKINNLITTDISAIDGSYHFVGIVSTVLQIFVSVAVLYGLLSWSSLVGFVLMAILTPAPTYIGKMMVKVQKEKMELTDKRVEAVTQSINVIRMLKLFAWEAYMLKELGQRRLDELKQMKRGKLLDIIMTGVTTTLPLSAKVVTFGIYALVIKGDLSASRFFSSLMVFTMLEEQLFQVMYTIPAIIQAKVSYDRYSDFFNNTEILENEKQKHDPSIAVAVVDHDKSDIGFNDCSFSWDSFDKPEGPGHSRRAFRLRFDGELLFQRGKINIIVGPTASGKTSILMALLGEMYYKGHAPGSWYNLPRVEGVAYAAQESWVLNETIKENILFGEPYNERRYKMTINHCALEQDLGLWEAGDLTEVGEKGLTLSGGQKARVTLARALYSHASIILLDDVLAALDVHTAKWIVEKALCGDLVKGRTVLLVTHNIALAAPIADFVVLLGRHGTVAASGSVSDVLRKDSVLREQVEKARGAEVAEIDEQAEEAGKDIDETARQVTGKLVVAEEKAMGRVELDAFMLFIKGIGGPLIWTFILSAVTTAMVTNLGQTWFVGFWSSQYENYDDPADVPVIKYLMIFALLNVLTVMSYCLSQAIWAFRSIRASRIIHSRLLESIFSATFRWLDITPVGRIIARCTQDISNIDVQFEAIAYSIMYRTVFLVSFFLSAVIMAGWYAFIPGLVLAVLGGFLGFVYLKCQLCTRREMSNAKAPVMSEIGTALGGLPSIRAYGAQEFFSSRLKSRIDTLSRASYTFYDINRWISVRIDALSGIYAASVSAFLVYGGKVNAGQAGFTISVVLAFSREILWWVRVYNFLEIQANSLERILGFLRIDHEPQSSNENLPPAYWPSSGSLRVENLSAQYSEDSPEVLKDISFNISPGERVGIVGRTGAGKSSIALALLRAIRTSGNVFYDNILTDKINLDALRSNITLIPQQPELIHGTLRANLDPFGQHEDAELNDALRVAGLFDIRDSIARPKADIEGQHGNSGEHLGNQGEGEASANIGLDTMVEGGGTNFSLGQRQIIALARAIVRRSKLLILDEATAAIDYDTDAIIQKTLRTEFSKDTTLITIAHRLQTIMDYDRIMVLDAGKLVEFDTPKKLLENKKGFLRALVDESEDKEVLHKLAQK